MLAPIYAWLGEPTFVCVQSHYQTTSAVEVFGGVTLLMHCVGCCMDRGYIVLVSLVFCSCAPTATESLCVWPGTVNEQKQAVPFLLQCGLRAGD